MGFTFTNIAAATAASAARYAASQSMFVGDYTLTGTLTPAWTGAGLVTVTHTQVGGVTDTTLGTIVITGVDLSGQVRTDTIVPIATTVATGIVPFRTITKVSGVGWALGSGVTADTITVGVLAGALACGSQGTLHAVLVNNLVATAVVIADANRTIITIPASQAVGTYFLLDVDFAGYLKVTTTNTNDVTVIHTVTMPQNWSAV